MISYGLLSFSAILLFAAEPNVDKQLLVFSFDEPQEFVSSLPKIALAPRSSRPLLASIEGPLTLEVVKGSGSVRMQCALAAVTEPVAGRCSFAANSEPMPLREAIKTVSKLLELVGSDNTSLDDWAANADRDKSSYAHRVVGKKQTVSLRIQDSLRDDAPWAITLSVGFDRRP
jgi:hypothetical protein